MIHTIKQLELKEIKEIKEINDAIKSRISAIGPNDQGNFHHLSLIWGDKRCLKEPFTRF